MGGKWDIGISGMGDLIRLERSGPRGVRIVIGSIRILETGGGLPLLAAFGGCVAPGETGMWADLCDSPEPDLSGGMIPSVAPPFGMTRWTPQTRQNCKLLST